MRLQPRPILADGIENARDAVGDIVLDNISHEERREIDAYDRINQIEPVIGGSIERTGQQRHDLVDDPVEGIGGNSREKTHEEG